MNKSNVLSLKPYLKPDSKKSYLSNSFMKNENVVLAVSTDLEFEDINPFSLEAFQNSAQLMRALYANGNRFSVVHGIRDQYNFLSKKDHNLNPVELIKKTQELVGLFLNTAFSDPSSLPLELPVVVPTHIEIEKVKYAFDYNDYSYESCSSLEILSILEINKIMN